MGEPERRGISVNKEQAISKFVRENQKLLTGKGCDSDTVKELRKEFFRNNSLSAGQRFTRREVAEAVASKIVKRQWENEETFIETALEIPYLSSSLTKDRLSTIYTTEKGPDDTVLTSEDISKISSDEYREQVEEQFKEKARAEVETELQQTRDAIERMKAEVEEEREELKEYKSELDSLPPDVPLEEIIQELDAEGGEDDSHPIKGWWEEVGLQRDPFPDNKGLIGIPEGLYEEVVVKTSFVKNYLDDAKNNPDSLLDKTILITGEYGSGKTTLFEYLESSLGGARILPIRIVLNPGPSVSSLTDKLYSQLYNQGSRVYTRRLGSDPRRDAWGEIETRVIEVLRELQDGEMTKGFLVTVDGLHKGDSYQEQVFEFLQQIQNVQEFFQNHKIRVGFVIAGSPLWEDKLASRPSVSGSFYRRDEIPPLPEDAAVEAVERRIRAFTPEGRSPPKIRRDGLRKAFRVIERREPRPVTFRAYLDHVRGRLEAREFEEAGLGVHLHLETIEEVHEALRETPLFEKYQEIWDRLLEKPRLRESVQHVLLGILHDEVLPEESAAFQENLHIFHLLRNHDFITKRKAAEGAVGWSLTADVGKTLTLIGEDLKIAPDDVLRAAFEEEAAARARESQRIYAGPLEDIEKMRASWGDTWSGVVELLTSTEGELEEIDQVVSEGRPQRLDRETLSRSIHLIISAANRIMYDEGSTRENEWLAFEEAWAAPENTEAYLGYRPESFNLPSNESEIFGILHQHSRLVTDLLELMEKLVKGEAVSRLRGRNLSDDDKGAIHKLRVNFLTQGYRGVIDGATELMENRIRGTVYPALRALWGSEARKRLPGDLVTKLKNLEPRGHPRAKRNPDTNFLYDLSRSEYSKVLFYTPIKKALIPDDWSEVDLDNLKSDMELAFSLNDRTAHRERGAYFREHATEIGDVIQALPKALELLNDISTFILKGCSFEYRGGNDRPIEATFATNQDLNPKPQPIKISREDGRSLTFTFLQILSSRPIQAETIESIGPVSSVAPEVQLALLRVLSENGAITVESGAGPPRIMITENGQQFLNRS